ncbi:MAG: hypothetical protein J5626_10010 [Lachnospiraceae bacterium]|nr:hypothetical protein [Lachnospiraceae bacterium]
MDGFFGFYGNSNSFNNGMCGGRHESWDPNAPKEIKSKNIVEFSAYFCSQKQFGFGNPEFLSPKVTKDPGTGEFILSCGYGELKTDKEFLNKLQGLIDRNQLVKENGHFMRIDGLSPEYQPYSFKAVYDSGEVLSFNVGGNPQAPWCIELRKLLCKELVKHGIEDMLPPKADRNVVRFDLKFYGWPRNIKYNNIYMQGDDYNKRCFHYMKEIWNKETDVCECDRIITVDEAFFEHISELIEELELREYCNGMIDYPDGMNYNTCREPVIGFCAQGESGRQFNTFTVGNDISDGLKEAAGVIRDYIESVFENYTGEEQSLRNPKKNEEAPAKEEN